MGPNAVPTLHGLDIETDTSVDGFDPNVSPIVAVAVSTDDADHVLTGDEATILSELDALLAGLAPGVIVTWNGSSYDLPYIAARAAALGVDLGLITWPDSRVPASTRLPPTGSPVAAAWHHHGHLDAYRIWRHVRGALGVSAGLKSVAAHVGLDPVVVDRSAIHELSQAEIDRYVASDARLTRQLAERLWCRAPIALDPPPAGDQRAIRSADQLS